MLSKGHKQVKFKKKISRIGQDEQNKLAGACLELMPAFSATGQNSYRTQKRLN